MNRITYGVAIVFIGLNVASFALGMILGIQVGGANAAPHAVPVSSPTLQAQCYIRSGGQLEPGVWSNGPNGGPFCVRIGQ